jgi:hypothetical protein
MKTSRDKKMKTETNKKTKRQDKAKTSQKNEDRHGVREAPQGAKQSSLAILPYKTSKNEIRNWKNKRVNRK